MISTLQLRYGGDWRLSETIKVLKPGDIILIQTPGAFYTSFRVIAGHEYDHMVNFLFYFILFYFFLFFLIILIKI